MGDSVLRMRRSRDRVGGKSYFGSNLSRSFANERFNAHLIIVMHKLA